MAGALRGLPDAQGILCGSIAVRPGECDLGNWAGIYACWGTENREVAVRFIKGGWQRSLRERGGEGRPVGQPVSRVGGILGLALDGMKTAGVAVGNDRRPDTAA